MFAKEDIWKRAAAFGSLSFAFEHNGKHECSVKTAHIVNGERIFENPSDGLAFILHIESLDFHFCFSNYLTGKKKIFGISYIPKNEQLKCNSMQLILRYEKYVFAALDSFERFVSNLPARHQ